MCENEVLTKNELQTHTQERLPECFLETAGFFLLGKHVMEHVLVHQVHVAGAILAPTSDPTCDLQAGRGRQHRPILTFHEYPVPDF